jgi:hypothetical protein
MTQELACAPYAAGPTRIRAFRPAYLQLLDCVPRLTHLNYTYTRIALCEYVYHAYTQALCSTM